MKKILVLSVAMLIAGASFADKKCCKDKKSGSCSKEAKASCSKDAKASCSKDAKVAAVRDDKAVAEAPAACCKRNMAQGKAACCAKTHDSKPVATPVMDERK